MKRRDFLLAGGTTLLLPHTAIARASWPNGQLQGSQFHWLRGGGDPYRGTFAHAAALAGVPSSVIPTLDQAIRQAPGGNSALYQIRDGDRLGVMVSGSPGWVARNTVAYPSRWPGGASRTAQVWYVDGPDGTQYRVMKAQVCGNWLFAYFGAPQQCRCQIGVDAC